LYFGAIISLLFFNGAVYVGAKGKMPVWYTKGEEGKWTEEGSKICRCEDQLSNRLDKLTEIEKDLGQTKKRIEYFKFRLDVPAAEVFVQAREELNREKEAKEHIERSKAGLEVVGPFLRGALIVNLIIAFGAALAFFVAWYSLKDAKRCFKDEIKIEKAWLCPYLILAGFLILWTLIEQTWTSILDTDKMWFGWDSFCVNPGAYVLMRLSMSADQFAFTCPLALFFLLSGKRYVPKIKLLDPGGRCGVGEYISFLQKWTFLGLIAGIVPIVIWLHEITRSHARFEAAYLITPVSSLAVIAFLIFRAVKNAYLLRSDYERVRAKVMGKSWSGEKAKNLPPDPTLEFLGDRFWKLPGVVVVVITAAYVALDALDFLGVREILTNLFR